MITVILGILLIAYGLLTIYLRVFKQSHGLGKLEKMQEFYGEKLGKALHITAYTILPILLGALALICHFALGIDIL